MKIPRNLTIKQILEKFRKIDSATGCWLWTLGRNNYGYGQVTINKKIVSVHRLSYETFINPLKNLCLHKLKCPNRHCFNPDHLYDGNRYDNIMDAIKLGYKPHPLQTHCLNGHEFDYITRSGARGCKTCKKARMKEYNKKLTIKRRLKKLEKLNDRTD
jgi:hypothetical protein